MPGRERSPSQGQFSWWWRAAEPKSQRIGSSFCGSSVKRLILSCAHVPMLRGGDVAHVVHVEAEQRAHRRLRQQLLDAMRAARVAAGRNRPGSPNPPPSCRRFSVPWLPRQADLKVRPLRSPIANHNSLLVAHLPRHREHVALIRNGRVLERRRERHGHVPRADSPHRAVEIVERTFRDDRRDLSRDAVPEVPLVNDDAARRLANRFDERLLVERPRRARIDHLRIDRRSLRASPPRRAPPGPCCSSRRARYRALRA